MSILRALGDDAARIFSKKEAPELFGTIQPPQAIECGGCAPPVYVETERQADQRFAEELRANNYARACGRHPIHDLSTDAE